MGESARAAWSRRDFGIALSLAIATTAAYLRVWRCGFLNFDDNVYVTLNPRVRGGFTLSNLKWVLVSFQPDNWFPVTRFSHLLDYSLFGDRAAGHHAVNLAIHILASLMLFLFLRQASGRRWPSAFVAAVFALHPLHVESVAWISERKDVLCAAFWFAALWAWTKWIRSESTRFYVCSLVLFGLGLMSKPMIVTFPVLLFLLDTWPFGRALTRETVDEKIPFLALSAIDACLTWRAQLASGAIHSLQTRGLGIRIENALVTPWIYVGKTVWPAGLSAVYSWPSGFSLWEPLAGGLALMAVSIGALTWIRRRPALAVGWFWFLVTLFPVIGLIQVGEQARADRYMYVPMVGLAIIAAWIVPSPRESAPMRVALAVIAAIVLAGSALATWRQTGFWTDSETLFRHAVNVSPEDYSAWFDLGNTLSLIPGAAPDAAAAFDSALRLKPDFIQARERLGTALFEMGRQSEGLIQYEETLRQKPDYVLAECDFGVALANAGRTAEAVAHLRRALSLDPNYVDALIDLGVVLESDPDRLDAAIALFQRAASLDPSNSLARQNLAKAETFREARRPRPLE